MIKILSWEWVGKCLGVIYWIMFIIGIMLLALSCWREIFSWKIALSSFPIVGSISAAYLWIRRDVWRDNETIRRLTVSNDKDYLQENLISGRADCQVALIFLILVAIAQVLSQESSLNWLVFLGEMLTFVPLGNWIARWIEEYQLLKFKNEN